MANRGGEMDDIMKVCRLCLGTDTLIWVFDNRIEKPENMKIQDVVFITTGVTITPSDNVSQMLCSKCLHITIKMFKFRSSSIGNDMELKAKATMKLKYNMDKSVESLLRKYPKIILPSSITKCNIMPSIVINKKDVTNWIENFKRKRRIEKEKRRELKQVAEKLREIENARINAEQKQETHPPIYEIESSSDESASLAIVQVTKTDDSSDSGMKRPQSQDIDRTSLNYSPHSQNKRKLPPISPDSPQAKKIKSGHEGADNSLVTLKYVTKSLFICNICNSILYSAKDLERHKRKHMRCILCKKSFRTLEETAAHSANGCTIKKIMNNLPSIVLRKCDEIKEIREEYPYLFNIKPEEKNDHPNMLSSTEAIINISEEIDNVVKADTNQLKSKTQCNTVYEISLISDDEDNDFEKTESLPRKEPTTQSNKSTNQPDKKSGPNKTKSKHVAQKKKTVPATATTITPSIQIVDKNKLDVNLDDNDMALLKNILSRTKNSCKERSMQTNMPWNNDIVLALNKDKLFELKNLRDHLNYYKIPVNISYSSQYSIRYGLNPSPIHKKDRTWSKMYTKTSNAPSVNNGRVDISSLSVPNQICIIPQNVQGTAGSNTSIPVFVIPKPPNVNSTAVTKSSLVNTSQNNDVSQTTTVSNDSIVNTKNVSSSNCQTTSSTSSLPPPPKLQNETAPAPNASTNAFQLSPNSPQLKLCINGTTPTQAASQRNNHSNLISPQSSNIDLVSNAVTILNKLLDPQPSQVPSNIYVLNDNNVLTNINDRSTSMVNNLSKPANVTVSSTNIMPPPSNTYVPQRTVIPVSKANQNFSPQPNSVICQLKENTIVPRGPENAQSVICQLKENTILPRAPENAHSEVPNLKPMIRVRSFAELT